MKIFGTDGFRGPVGEPPITPEILTRIGAAVAREAAGDGPVLIGRDTRDSGEMIEAALIAGCQAAGAPVVRIGVAPTPAVSVATRARGARLGVAITASHNPYTDNGVKLFGSDGYKVSEAFQESVEAALDRGEPRAAGAGAVETLADGLADYEAAFHAALPADVSLAGLNVVVDAANGAAFDVGPRLLAGLGAEVTAIGVSPNGRNINLECGSNHPQGLAAEVKRAGADVGVAFDGDADRVVLCDAQGGLIDGDQILGALAADALDAGGLKGGAVAATVMSNLGLERYLDSKGAALIRTPVGDRHVVAAMREGGYGLGGEQSGHIVLGDVATTGDGPLAAAMCLALVARTGRPAAECLRVFEPAPQALVNVRYGGGDPLGAASVKAAIADAEAALGDAGRLVIRKSGTEPVIRVMVEALDGALAERLAADLADEVRRV
ncbi:MAG: phosphoglucosamine mutase [Pseudomonadota bacterium]